MRNHPFLVNTCLALDFRDSCGSNSLVDTVVHEAFDQGLKKRKYVNILPWQNHKGLRTEAFTSFAQETNSPWPLVEVGLVLSIRLENAWHRDNGHISEWHAILYSRDIQPNVTCIISTAVCRPVGGEMGMGMKSDAMRTAENGAECKNLKLMVTSLWGIHRSPPGEPWNIHEKPAPLYHI